MFAVSLCIFDGLIHQIHCYCTFGIHVLYNLKTDTFATLRVGEPDPCLFQLISHKLTESFNVHRFLSKDNIKDCDCIF